MEVLEDLFNTFYAGFTMAKKAYTNLTDPDQYRPDRGGGFIITRPSSTSCSNWPPLWSANKRAPNEPEVLGLRRRAQSTKTPKILSRRSSKNSMVQDDQDDLQLLEIAKRWLWPSPTITTPSEPEVLGLQRPGCEGGREVRQGDHR